MYIYINNNGITGIKTKQYYTKTWKAQLFYGDIVLLQNPAAWNIKKSKGLWFRPDTVTRHSGDELSRIAQ